jgi:hypothetical protein
MYEQMATAYAQLQQEIGNVKLLAVSKRQPLEKIQALYQLGQRLFAENYVQEAVEKIKQLDLADVQWHFIGQIQSNKTKMIVQHFDWVQSIDRLSIAERLQKHCIEFDKVLQVCINVNIDDEVQKGGVMPAEVVTLAEQMQQLTRLKLRGIMAIPRPCVDYQQQLAAFEKVKQLFDTLNQRGFAMDTLSIGMSSDYKAAIAAGSTMLRIGTSLFGARE